MTICENITISNYESAITNLEISINILTLNGLLQQKYEFFECCKIIPNHNNFLKKRGLFIFF